MTLIMIGVRRSRYMKKVVDRKSFVVRKTITTGITTVKPIQQTEIIKRFQHSSAASLVTL